MCLIVLQAFPSYGVNNRPNENNGESSYNWKNYTSLMDEKKTVVGLSGVSFHVHVDPHDPYPEELLTDLNEL